MLSDDNQLADFTLIVPTVAVGNVAQLTIDLLIHNCDMKRIGRLETSDFIPFLGADPYDSNSSDISTTADFYVNREKRIIALQIRSPPAFNRLDHFFKKLRVTMKKWKILEVIILTSQWQYVRVDSQLRSKKLHYVASPPMELKHGNTLRRLEWINSGERPNNSECLEISGGGFSTKLFAFLCAENIPCAILIKFCSEGNNSPDAKELAHFFDEWTSLLPEKSKIHWKEPPSWLHTFGHGPPYEIY